MAGKLNLRSAADRQAEREAAAGLAWQRKHASGPTLARCDECGAFAAYATGDFGRPDDDVERFCDRHAPESLKRPGDFPSDPRL